MREESTKSTNELSVLRTVPLAESRQMMDTNSLFEPNNATSTGAGSQTFVSFRLSSVSISSITTTVTVSCALHSTLPPGMFKAMYVVVTTGVTSISTSASANWTVPPSGRTSNHCNAGVLSGGASQPATNQTELPRQIVSNS